MFAEIIVEVFSNVGVPAGMAIIILYLFLSQTRAFSKSRTEHKLERDEWRNSTERTVGQQIAAIDAVRESSERLQDRSLDLITEYRADNKEIHYANIHAIEELTAAIKSRDVNSGTKVKKAKK